MTTRRRKRRSPLNPLRWIPPQTWATIAKSIAGGLVVASPAVAIKQGQDASVKLHASNDNTTAALSAVAMLIDQQDALKSELEAVRADIRTLRFQYVRLLAKSPAMAFGPEIPSTWLPQPPRKRKFLGIF